LALLLIIDFNRAWILLSVTLVLCLVIALAKRIFRDDINKLLLPIFLIIISATLFFVNTSSLQNLIFKTQFSQEQVLSQKYSFTVAFKAATENIKSALIGSGTGTFYHDFTKFKPAEFNQTSLWQIRFDRSGNNFAEILATMGFLGIASYLLLIVFFLIIGYLFIRQNRDALPLIMTFLALVVGQFVYYQNTTMAFCFWLFMALSAVILQKSASEKVFSLKNFPEMALVFSVLLMALGFGILSIYFFGVKFYLADVNYQKFFAENRIERLERATVLNPYQSVYRVSLSRLYLDKFVSEAQKSANEIDQNALSVYAFQAINYSKGGQVGNVYIKGATELAPNNVICWETLGIVYRQLQGLVEGASDWAIKSFEKAMSLEPTNPVLLTEIGKIYVNKGDIQKAREESGKAKELKSDYADAFLQEASIYEKEGNLDEAISQIEILAASYPMDPEIILELGRLYFNKEQTDKAIVQFQKAIALEPNYSNAHYSLGIAYEKNGEISKAIIEFKKVLSLNPGNADIQKKIEQLESSE
jgi:Tfp pilus assembly protein PilF